ncbi:MAG: DUF4369 domain-containing protein, partial [Hymenobacter sp.]
MQGKWNWLHLLWAGCLLACTSRPGVAADQISIEGNVSHLPDGKLYLIGGYSHALLDSTNCRNGQFRFLLKTDSAFTPSLASIQYPDRLKTRRGAGHVLYDDCQRLLFRNYTRGADSLKYFNSAFMLEKGRIRLTGDAASDGGVRVFG